MSLKGEEFSL